MIPARHTAPKSRGGKDNDRPGIVSVVRQLVSETSAMLIFFGVLLPLVLLSFRAASRAEALVRTLYVEPHHDLHKALQDLCVGSQKLYETVAGSLGCFYDEGENVLGTTRFMKNMYSMQPYVSNGYIGARLSTLGQGFSYDEINIHSQTQSEDVLMNGWPLFNKRNTGAFAAGFFSLQEHLPSTNFPELYEDGYDSVISTLPYWFQFEIEYADENGTYVFTPQAVIEDEITHYHQNMSIRNGLVATKLRWRNTIEIQIEVFAHMEILPLSVMTVSMRPLDETLDVIIRDTLNASTSQRTILGDYGYDNDGIYMVVSPDNVPYSRAAVFSSWDVKSGNAEKRDDQSVINEAHLELLAEHVTTVQKYIGVVSTELDAELAGIELSHAKAIALVAKNKGRNQLFESHDKRWSSQFEDTNIFIPSDELLTLAARSSLFHLLTNTNSVSVNLTSALGSSGLSSDSYGGMVFWDTDLWIVPGILPFSPETAKAVSNYRNFTHPQAVENARGFGYDGAIYPWTSARFGNCTSSGPCLDYEYHVNVDVALSSWLLYLAGESEEYLEFTTWPLLRDASNFLSQYVTFNETLGKYTTHNLTDPDEYANNVDNGAFTNAGIDSILKVSVKVAHHLAKEVPPIWTEVMNNIYIPVSHNNITLEYSHMNASVSIKQADVVMLTFPLDYHVDDQRAIDDLFYYSLKQSDVGPAMTFPIFTVASRRLFSYGCSSQSYLQKSVLPYIRSPFGQFSEQADDNVLTNGGTNPAFPFLTAHGGFLQALVYGVLGLRYASRVDASSQRIERYLLFDPVKPLALPGGLKINGFRYLNQRLDVSLTDFYGIIEHRGTEPISIEVNKRNKRPGNHTLYPGDRLKVPVFEPPLNMPGSVSECRLATNLTEGMPAEVPLSAIDGNNYTYWQAFNRDPARLFIDLGVPQRLKNGLAIWGQRPPKSFSLWVSDDSKLSYDDALKHMDDMSFVQAINNMTIEISESFEEKYLKRVMLLPSNKTSFEFEPHIQEIAARFLLVEITGTIDDDDLQDGATINEFAVFPKFESYL